MKCRSGILGLALGLLFAAANPLTAQDDCKFVLDAMTKVFDTPTHAYVTMNLSGKPETGESIYVGGVTYAKYTDKWVAGSSTQQQKTQAEKNWRTNKITCRHLKDETVGGVLTAVYSVHEVSPKSTSDSTTWISKAKGLPVRSEIDAAGVQNHISMRYEYSNVKPPM
jgi:hypothetical protein